MKEKFGHVKKLESALEKTLGMHKSTNSEIKSTTTLGASENGAGSHNNRLIQSILRVIRKLKIELHADYIVLG